MRYISVYATTGSSNPPCVVSMKIGRLVPLPWWRRLWLWIRRKPHPMEWVEVNPSATFTARPDEPPFTSVVIESPDPNPPNITGARAI